MFWRKCLASSFLILSGSVSFAAGLPTPTESSEANSSAKTCFEFTENNWIFASNRPATLWPKVNSGVLTLLPDNLFRGAAAAIMRTKMRPPFEATFEFRTFDDDGGVQYPWNSADGISFFFYKDGRRFGTPPNGGFMGFSAKGGGYAIQMPTYGQRRIRLRAASGLTFQTNPFRQAYTHGEWVPMKIHVFHNRVMAWSSYGKLVDVALNFETEFSDLGFSAATGAADSEHQVRKFCLSSIPYKSEVEHKPEAKPELKATQKPKSKLIPKIESKPEMIQETEIKAERPSVILPSHPIPELKTEEPKTERPDSGVESTTTFTQPVKSEPEVELPKGPIEPYVVQEDITENQFISEQPTKAYDDTVEEFVEPEVFEDDGNEQENQTEEIQILTPEEESGQPEFLGEIPDTEQ